MKGNLVQYTKLQIKLSGTTSFSVLIRNLFTDWDIADQGFCKIWDLFSGNDEQLNPEQSFFIMRVIISMPAAWRLLIRTANIAPVISPLSNTPAILLNYILIPILDAFSKFKAQLSVFSGEKKQTTPTAKEKLTCP